MTNTLRPIPRHGVAISDGRAAERVHLRGAIRLVVGQGVMVVLSSMMLVASISGP